MRQKHNTKLIDLTGHIFGRWIVLSRADNSPSGQTKWLCRCDCGNSRAVFATTLRDGTSRSCGCLKRELAIKRLTIDITGRKYGRLTAIREIGIDTHHNTIWLCKCECGNEISVSSRNLRHGKVKSCGCLKAELILPHGEASFNHLFGRMLDDAKGRGNKWELTRGQLRALTKQPCHYCGTEPMQCMRTANSTGAYIYNGLDRVDNNLGYTIDNVVACCGHCNKAKNTMTIKEFKLWVSNVYEHFAKED